MRDRTQNPKNPSAKNYMERGIKVCPRWNHFKNFLADMGEKPKGMSLERINNDGDYEPGNCKWGTPAEQTLNRRCTIWVVVDGETMCLKQASLKLGINYGTAQYRNKVGKFQLPTFRKTKP